MKLNYFDIHSHLQEKQFDVDRTEVLGRMRRQNIESLVVGVDYASSQRAVKLARQSDGLWAVIGVHPVDDTSEVFDGVQYDALVAQGRGKVVAIGECGLEYFRMDDEEREREKPRQKRLFEDQIQFALKHDLPLMLHCRPTPETMDSYEDTLDILELFAKEYGKKIRGNVHFFVGNVIIAKRFLVIGFTLSFTGVLTFTNDYDEVVKYAPLDMIQAETDAPYVTPTPYRGQRNEPSYVSEVVKRIAEIRNESVELVQETLVKQCITSV